MSNKKNKVIELGLHYYLIYFVLTQLFLYI